MRFIVFLSLALVATNLIVASGQQEPQQQKRILRRVIKSTPTATNLGRVRLVTVRAAGPAEKGAVSEISSKEAANFGQRSSNETNTQQQPPAATKSSASAGNNQAPTPSNPSSITPTSSNASKTNPSTTTTTSSTTTTSTTTTAPPTSSTLAAAIIPKASERQQAAPEAELLSSAPSSWQMMTAVEAPAAALIAAGTRPASQASSSSANDLSSSSSEYSSLNHNDFLRASSATKTSSSSTGQTYSSLRQQSGKTRQSQQQQSFFYPQPQQQQQLRQGKTSNYQATKTQWYQPTSTTTSRPAPLVEEPQYEQYVEQQVDSAPPGQAEPFAFDFNTQDTSGNGQYRKEESDNNGVVRGSYGFRDANGLYRHVEYVADHNGFRANIKSNEPGLEGGRDSQPADIRLDSGPAIAPARLSNNDNGDWTSASSSAAERANLALAPPDFESSHKAERIRGNFRS